MARHGGIQDKGEYFVITPTSRKITIPHSQKAISVKGDHNSEQITFECPQIIDGHDISQCEHRYVTWINVLGEVGHDELQLAQVEQGTEGKVYLAWTIRNALTVAKGVVQFSVHFEDTDDNGTTLYRWSTATCKDCEILDSINAVLGAYEAIYVSEETLVIADYTPVANDTISLETNGLIPEGIKEITANGTYDVGEYATAKVDVLDDPDLQPENIKAGVEIFGVEGTTVLPEEVSARLLNYTGNKIWVTSTNLNKKNNNNYTINSFSFTVSKDNREELLFQYVKGSPITICVEHDGLTMDDYYFIKGYNHMYCNRRNTFVFQADLTQPIVINTTY